MSTPKSVEVFGGSVMSPVPDPYSVYRRLREEQPVLVLDTTFGRQYLVTRYDDVFTILKDKDLFSSRSNAQGVGIVMGRTILEMDGREHLRHRRIVTPALSPHALKARVEEIARIADDLIDGFVVDGHADLVEQFTFTFPMRVITHILGIPVEDHRQFHQWGLDLISIGENSERAFEAARKIVGYLDPILQRRKVEPRDDLLSTLAHAEVDGSRLTDEEVLSFLRLLLPAGAETTYRLIGSCMFALLTHPDQFEEVRASPEKIDLVVEETLRWESPVQYCSREPNEAVTIAGVEIPGGGGIQCALGSANRDPRHYPDPDRFDMHRRPSDHLGFGFGQHFCAGSHLARMEARTALELLVQRLPNLRLDATRPCRVVGLAFRSPDRLPVLFGS